MLLRPGGVPRAEIERVLGRALVQPPADAGTDSVQPLAPGMLTSHYAPRARVRLNAQRLEPGEALLAFGLGAISGIDAASISDESVGARRPRRRLPPICSAIFARSTAKACTPSR